MRTNQWRNKGRPGRYAGHNDRALCTHARAACNKSKGARRRRDFTVLDRFWVLFITVSGVYLPHKELQTQWRFAKITQQKTTRAMQRHSQHTRQQCKLGNFNHNSRCVHNQQHLDLFFNTHQLRMMDESDSFTQPCVV